jgi:uncharacterized protein (TIGR02145 family)
MKKFFAMMMIASAVFAACEKDKGDENQVDPNTVTYEGVTYKTVTLSDGSTWMAEPLRVIPAGKTVSEDPKNGGVWYPYEVKDGAPTPLKDEASIAKLGYLYDAATAFGVEAITKENYNTFEGTRGICPEGWHIPTRADYISTFGYATKADGETADTVNQQAPFYTETNNGGCIVKANELGFNFSFTGAIIAGAYNKNVIDNTASSVEAFYGSNRLNYLIGSTAYKLTENTDGSMKNVQYFYGMTTFTKTFPTGRLNAAYGAYNYAGQVRCVKNK